MCLSSPTNDNANVTLTTTSMPAPPSDTTQLVSACPHGRRQQKYDCTTTSIVLLLPTPSTATATTTNVTIASTKSLHSPTALRLQRLGHVLGLLAGLLQALGVILIHGVLSLSPYSFSIFVPLLIVAVLFISVSLMQLTLSSSSTSSYSRLHHLCNRLTALSRLPRSAKTSLLLRAGVGGMLYAASLYSLQHIQAPVAVTIFATAPSLASVFSAVFLRCSVARYDIFILLVNTCGVFLVANPFHSSTNSTMPLTASGLFAAVLNTIFIAASFTIAKSLGTHVDATTHILAVGLGVLAVSPLFYDHDNIANLIKRPALVLLLIVAEGFEWASQYVMARAIEFCHPGRLLVMRSVNVPMTCMLSMMFLGERLGAMQTVGVCVVLGSIVYNGLEIAGDKKTQIGEMTLSSPK